MFRDRRNRSLSFRQKKSHITPGLFREFFSWIIYSVIAIFFAFVLVLAFGMRVQVMGESMEPGLKGGQSVLNAAISWYSFRGVTNGRTTT